MGRLVLQTAILTATSGEGELGIDPGWFHIYKAEEDVIETNIGYEMEEFHLGYFGFGSSLGGIMFAFKINETQTTKVYGIPFDSIDPEDIYIVSKDFIEFAEAMGGVWDVPRCQLPDKKRSAV